MCEQLTVALTGRRSPLRLTDTLRRSGAARLLGITQHFKLLGLDAIESFKVR